jgi:hypothetical protein
MLTHPSLDQLTQLGLPGQDMKLGFTSAKDCPPCGCMLAGVQAAARRRSPRAAGSRRIAADFDINLAIYLCRALPVAI